ncbi:Fanconi anemia group D2 protein homolog [Glossina fuscipes fuscipes]
MSSKGFKCNFFQYSNLYLKIIAQNGFKVFEKHLKQNPEQVRELLKNLQISRRYLHRLCCDYKPKLNTVNTISSLRETLQNYLFRVKALLTASDCA